VPPSQHSAVLSWTGSTSTDVTGYYVYRDTMPNPTTKLNPTAPVPATSATQYMYTDANVQSATTYYYVVTAVDSSGLESEPSNQATAAIP
jgi:TolB protein